MAKYKVVSSREVLGHTYGEVVEFEDKVQAARLVAGGHVELVKEKRSAKSGGAGYAAGADPDPESESE